MSSISLFISIYRLSLFKSEVSYGNSANLDPLIKEFEKENPTFDKVKASYKYESYPGFGFDLGAMSS
jgi:hypothetical protein